MGRWGEATAIPLGWSILRGLWKKPCPGFLYPQLSDQEERRAGTLGKQRQKWASASGNGVRAGHTAVSILCAVRSEREVRCLGWRKGWSVPCSVDKNIKLLFLGQPEQNSRAQASCYTADIYTKLLSTGYTWSPLQKQLLWGHEAFHPKSDTQIWSENLRALSPSTVKKGQTPVQF